MDGTALTEQRPHATTLWPFVYGLMIAASVGVFLLVRSYGEALHPAPAAAAVAPPAGGTQPNLLFHVLLALAAVIAAGRIFGLLFALIHQPPVIGEVVAGICLGPSVLGWIAPGASAYVLPSSAAPLLGVVAQLGVILYMFAVGLELNAPMLIERAHATILTSHASIIAPFLLGVVLALRLYPGYAGADITFTTFALFLGVAMSITAFPVLARILTDFNLHRTPLGVLAVGCAAIDDVTAWCLLAVVVGVAQAKVHGAIGVIALTVAYIVGMLLVARPLLTRWASRTDEPRVTRTVVAAVLTMTLGSALATELIGVHAIFGAFLLGAVIPHDSAVARVVTRKLEDVVTILLLPAFFALTGMRTQIGLLDGLDQWLVCAAIIGVATIGKFGGTFVAARLSGQEWRMSAALGVLLNTRGLMELIVLNIGLDLGVISPTLFAMMVIMALVTTMGAAPLLQGIKLRILTNQSHV